MTKDELHGTNKEQDNKPKTEQKTGGSGAGAGAASAGASTARPAVFAPRGPSLTPPAPAPRGMSMMRPMMPQAKNLAPIGKPPLTPVASAPKKPDDTDDNG